MRSFLMRIFQWILLLVLLPGMHLSAQKEDMRFYGDVMSTALFKDSRVRASDSFNLQLKWHLEEANSFEDPLNFLPWLSILYPQDSTFRIITYQLEIDDYQYKYFGFIQSDQGELVVLQDEANKDRDLQYAQLTPETWYGSKYYEIQTFDGKEGQQYLLLGFDAFSQFQNKRVAEVMYKEDGGYLFGKPVFVLTEEDEGVHNRLSRLFMTYSFDSRVVCTFDPELNMLMKDHLIPVRERYPGQGNTWVPDGSYEGFLLESGLWFHKEKVFDHIYEKAPVNPPADRDKQLDLFGRKKG